MIYWLPETLYAAISNVHGEEALAGVIPQRQMLRGLTAETSLSETLHAKDSVGNSDAIKQRLSVLVNALPPFDQMLYRAAIEEYSTDKLLEIASDTSLPTLLRGYAHYFTGDDYDCREDYQSKYLRRGIRLLSATPELLDARLILKLYQYKCEDNTMTRLSEMVRGDLNTVENALRYIDVMYHEYLQMAKQSKPTQDPSYVDAIFAHKYVTECMNVVNSLVWGVDSRSPEEASDWLAELDAVDAMVRASIQRLGDWKYSKVSYPELMISWRSFEARIGYGDAETLRPLIASLFEGVVMRLVSDKERAMAALHHHNLDYSADFLFIARKILRISSIPGLGLATELAALVESLPAADVELLFAPEETLLNTLTGVCDLTASQIEGFVREELVIHAVLSGRF